MTFTVYDHNQSAGSLQAWASSVNIPIIDDVHKGNAVDSLLRSESNIFFVHLDDKAHWQRLIANIDESKYIFRFATHGFPPTPPAGKHTNCFHVNPRTQGEGRLTGDQISELKDILGNPIVLDSLRVRSILPEIRPYIWFEEPHWARALHILLQARLAQWAGTPGHHLQSQAQTILGCGGSFSAGSQRIDWPGLLRRLISRGITVSTDGKEPTAKQLVEGSLKCLRNELGMKSGATESPIMEVERLITKILETPVDLQDQDRRGTFEAELFALVEKAFEALNVACGSSSKKGV